MVSSIKVSLTTVLVLALMISLLPFAAFAQSTDGERPERGSGAKFCENLEEAEDRALAKLSERKAGSDRSGEADSKKAERLAELDSNRTTKEADRDTRYDELRAKASTDEQSAAIEDFIATVEGLVADRKAAVDAAIAVFEAAVEDLLGDRDEAIDSYANGIEDDIKDIFEDAEEACEDDEDDADVAAQVRADFTAMRETIKAERDQYSFKDELEEARTVRKAATEAAKATFQAGYEAAKTDLKAALGVSE